MQQRESRSLEFKREISNSFLKTVSAFANYGTGQIIFGIDDEGNIAALNDPIDACLRIENKINDTVEPIPSYTLDPNMDRGTITLTVFEGANKPYTVHGKAYRRNDSATIPVDQTDFKRLVLEGTNVTFDQLPSKDQDLHFSSLESAMHEKLGVEKLDVDVMRTFGLADPRGKYTNAAALLADANPFKGLDIVRFGDTINEFLEREDLSGASVIDQLESSVTFFKRHYTLERIVGEKRVAVERIPVSAFREAVANAIVHRDWDIMGCITIGMHPDRVVVASPGGLPSGITEDDYISGHISVLRNPLLANAFFRLGHIEQFGTGTLRIATAYNGTDKSPIFEVRGGSISVTLPVLDALPAMTTEEAAIYALLDGQKILSRSEIEALSGFSKDKTVRLLNSLESKGAVRKTGKARATRYSRG